MCAMTGIWNERLRLAVAGSMGIVAAIFWWWILNTDDIIRFEDEE